MKILVLGNREHEGAILGNTFDYLEDPKVDYCLSSVEFDENNYDVVLLTQEWKPDTRLCLYRLKRAKVPLVYVMDGVLEWDYLWHNTSFVHPEKATVLQPLVSDVLCVIGRRPARILASLGLADKIEIVGVPRFDGRDWKRIERKFVKPKVVVATARTFCHNVAHEIAVKKAISDLVKYFSVRNHLDVSWRLSDELYDEFKLPRPDQHDLLAELTEADALIGFTSTVLLEGMRLGVPTAQIDYRSSPQLLETAWSIRSESQIDDVVQELLHPPTEKISYQDFCLDDELCYKGSSSERLAQIVRNCVEEPASEILDQVQDSLEEEEVGELDFRQVHSQISSFSIRDKAVLQYELDAAYRYQSLLRKLIYTWPYQVLGKVVELFGWLPGFRKARRYLDKLRNL